TELRARSRFIAFLTARSREKPICKFHGVTGEIWKERVPKNSRTRSKGEYERWLTTTAGRENFSRSAIGVHGKERRSRRSREPGKLVVMLAFKFCIHMRAGAHHSWRHRRHMNLVARQLRPHRIGQTCQRKFACAIGRHMRHHNFAANRRNIDDASPTPDAHFWNDL